MLCGGKLLLSHSDVWRTLTGVTDAGYQARGQNLALTSDQHRLDRTGVRKLSCNPPPENVWLAGISSDIIQITNKYHGNIGNESSRSLTVSSMLLLTRNSEQRMYFQH